MEPEAKGPLGRRIMIGAGVVAAVLVLGFGARRLGLFGGGSEAAAQQGGEGGMGQMPPMPVDVDSARPGDVVDAVRATGRIEAIQSVELRPDEQGRVVELLFQEGQTVEQGAPLVRIDDALLRAQADRARADRDLALQQRDRVRRLRAENAASPADLERGEAAARAAEAALAVIELQVERSVVRAPFSGVVGQRFVNIGDYATTSTRLLALQTMDPQHVIIEVPERYAGQVRRGQLVEFTVASQPGRTYRAHVEFIDPAVQPVSRTILVKARAPNPAHVLRSGMFVEARLATATRRAAVLVPEDAIQPQRSGNIAWAIVDGRADRRTVELGVRSQGVVEIVRGIAAGELVVVGGLERMGQGMPVAPQLRGAMQAPREAAAEHP
jgi:membrane fusion protein (multidrug efflux system)